MDADALPLSVELRATEQDGKPLLELRRKGDARYKSSVRNTLYRLSDPYTLFYSKFLHNANTKDEHW